MILFFLFNQTYTFEAKKGMLKKIQEASSYILSQIETKPRIGLVLGSGLSSLGNTLKNKIVIPYSQIPHFPESTIEGHDGNLIIGELGNKAVVAMQGRFHYYEGYNMDEVCIGIRTLKLLGIEYFFVTNASGGLNPSYRAGDLMLITDHINFFPEHPLRGKNYDEFGPRFPDMSKTYDKQLIEKARAIAQEENILLHEGIYIGSSGPSLETPAEYRLFRMFGADATGMSTVPEIIVAHHAGILCCGISVITNGSEPSTPGGETTHDEVQINAMKATPNLSRIFTKLIETL